MLLSLGGIGTVTWDLSVWYLRSSGRPVWTAQPFNEDKTSQNFAQKGHAPGQDVKHYNKYDKRCLFTLTNSVNVIFLYGYANVILVEIIPYYIITYRQLKSP